MLKGFILSLMGMSTYFFAFAQYPTDSLLKILKQNPPDTTSYKIFLQLGNLFQQSNADTAIYFHQKAIEKANVLKDTFKIVQAMNQQVIDCYISTNHEKGKKIAQDLLKIISQSSSKSEISRIEASAYNLLGLIEKEQSNFAIATEYFFKALRINEKSRI